MAIENIYTFYKPFFRDREKTIIFSPFDICFLQITFHSVLHHTLFTIIYMNLCLPH